MTDTCSLVCMGHISLVCNPDNGGGLVSKPPKIYWCKMCQQHIMCALAIINFVVILVWKCCQNKRRRHKAGFFLNHPNLDFEKKPALCFVNSHIKHLYVPIFYEKNVCQNVKIGSCSNVQKSQYLFYVYLQRRRGRNSQSLEAA